MASRVVGASRDHVAGAAEAKEATGAPLSLHAGDEGWLEALPRQAEMFGFEPVVVPAVDHRPVDGETFRLGAFEGQDEYVFRHGLVREAAYAMLTDADRTLGHRLAAR